MAASNLRFGPGSAREVGQDLRHSFGASRVVVFVDPQVRRLACFETTVLESLERAQVRVEVYDGVRVEPDDESFRDAIDFLKQRAGEYDAVVAVGGGSAIDTAKAANLYACYPDADFYDFVNAPVGKGLPVPDVALSKPLVAVPTTAGTGSETTGVAIFDDTETRSKTGIASRHLKPQLGIVDPELTRTMPPNVAKYSGLDVLCHAVESYTALPYTRRPKPASPMERPAYQGSNPLSDVWSLYALKTCSEYLPRAVRAAQNNQQQGESDDDGGDDLEARTQLQLASSSAGMGFGNAGVHLCHGMSYPVASQVREYKGYEWADHPLVPHGLSVVANAPAVFAFTGPACPDRHAACARILAYARSEGGRVAVTKNHVADRDAGLWLADEIRYVCHLLDVPMGLRSFGYAEDDVPQLVEGTLPQHRVTKISPRPVGRAELEALFLEAL